MNAIKTWAGVRGVFTLSDLAVEVLDGVACIRHESGAILHQLTAFCAEAKLAEGTLLELEIEFESTGSARPARYYGEMPEYDDDRRVIDARLTRADGDDLKLPPELVNQLAIDYRDQIDDVVIDVVCD